MVSERTRLDTERIAALLAELASRLDSRGVAVDIVVVGGAAMALSVRPHREATVDIDVFANITEQVERVIDEIAREEELPADWLNAKALQFMSPVASHSDLSIQEQVGMVTIRLLDSASLLAMKLRAGRIGKDFDDIKSLVELLELTSLDEAQSVLDDYYGGEEEMKPAAKQLLQSIFDPS